MYSGVSLEAGLVTQVEGGGGGVLPYKKERLSLTVKETINY